MPPCSCQERTLRLLSAPLAPWRGCCRRSNSSPWQVYISMNDLRASESQVNPKQCLELIPARQPVVPVDGWADGWWSKTPPPAGSRPAIHGRTHVHPCRPERTTARAGCHPCAQLWPPASPVPRVVRLRPARRPWPRAPAHGLPAPVPCPRRQGAARYLPGIQWVAPRLVAGHCRCSPLCSSGTASYQDWGYTVHGYGSDDGYGPAGGGTRSRQP
jgi:hypothetical protein